MRGRLNRFLGDMCTIQKRGVTSPGHVRGIPRLNITPAMRALPSSLIIKKSPTRNLSNKTTGKYKFRQLAVMLKFV